MYISENYFKKIMIITYNIPLMMNNDAFSYWHNQLEQAKMAFNECATYLHNSSLPLSIKTVHNNVYDWMRNKYNDLSAQSVIKIYKDVISSFKSIKCNKQFNAEIPQRKQLVMRLDKRLYSSLRLDGITIPTGQPYKRELVPFNLFPKAEFMLKNYIAHDPTIFERNGVMFLSVPFEVPEKPTQNDACIGVDLGMRQLFVTSEGKAFKDTKYLEKRRKVRYLKSKLKSVGTKSAKRHLKKIKKKERNISKDMCYRASKALIDSTEASIIVFEDLSKIKKNTSRTEEGHKRKRHNNAQSQVPYYLFRMIVTYKAQLSGKEVETVSAMYTSQIDCRTNKRDGKRQGRRYVCSDGTILDADWNAAINIGLRSKHPILSSIPYEGGIKPIVGRVQVNHPIVESPKDSASR